MKMVNKQARKKGIAVGLAAENWDYSRKKKVLAANKGNRRIGPQTLIPNQRIHTTPEMGGWQFVVVALANMMRFNT